jgi:hypothetical protein
LKAEGEGDRWLLYKVPVADKNGTVPAFVAIGFFLEDMGAHNKLTPNKNIRRTLPGESPDSQASSPSPTRRHVRQRSDSMDSGNYLSPSSTEESKADQAASSRAGWFNRGGN